MKAIIIDNEQTARSGLSNLLRANYRQLEIVGEAANGLEGLECIRQLKPDLVFLDVEIPKKNGFQLLEELGAIDFALIFVTASKQFAAQAYEYSPVDYLLKPMDERKLMRALIKAQEFKRLREIDRQRHLLLDIAKKQEIAAHYHSRITFNNQQETAFVFFIDLIRIEGNGNCSSVYAVGESKCICVTRNIGKYFEELKNVPFLFQTHRCHLVNLYHVKKFIKKDGGSIVVRNHNGGPDVEIPVAKKYKAELISLAESLQVL